MRIASVEAIVVRFPSSLPRPPSCRGCPASALADCTSVLVRIATDTGVVGWGESQALTAPAVGATIIRSVLAPVLTGVEFGGTRPETEALWERMYQLMRVCGQTGGFMLDAISGVDLALWDIAGKVRDVPVSVLLAGANARRSVEFSPPMVYFDADEQSLLERVDGSSAVHALWRLDPTSALRIGRELDYRGALWLECPFPPEEVAAHIRLSRKIGTPLAVGGSYRTCYEIAPFLQERAAGIVRPNLGRCGITEGLRVAKLAAENAVEVVPQLDLSAGPLAAATLQFAAALPDLCGMVPYNDALLRAMPMLAVPLEVRESRYQVPGGPGLGIQIDEAELQMAQASGMWEVPADKVAVIA